MNETVDPERVEVDRPAAPAPQRPAPKRYRWGRLVLALAIIAVAIVGWRYVEPLSPSSSQGKRHAEPQAQTVRSAPVVKGDMPILINALGAVTPFATITVKTQIAGRLMEVGFQEGQTVKAGDFLAQIDPRPYAAALAQAEAQLAKDTSLSQQAQADLARYETLSKQDSIARQQVDDQKFLVAQDKAAMASDQAQIDTAKLNISYCRIVSPIDGRVGLRLVDPGNYLQPSDATGIVVIAQIHPISVVFSTPEDNLPQISARLDSGAKLPVTVYDRANVREIDKGSLTTYDNQIDAATGTFKLRASFPNPTGALFPNQFVNVRLLVDTVSGAALAPNAAIQLGANGNFVYVVKADSTVAVRQVTTGPSDAQNTVIPSGLAVGDEVVIDGADRLRDGAQVRVRNAASAPTQKPAPGADAGQHTHRHGGHRSSEAPAPAPASGSP